MENLALTRLILIDSYKPGALQEVRLEGHTNQGVAFQVSQGLDFQRCLPELFGERSGYIGK